MRIQPRLISQPQAARYLGLTTKTLNNRQHLGTAPPRHKINGRWYYLLEDLDRWIDDRIGVSRFAGGVR